VTPHRIAVVVQARTTSSRLPRKVLLPLAGAPAIVRMLERVQRVTRSDLCLVATSSDPSDDQLADVCSSAGVAVSRGQLSDVLGRVASAVPSTCDVVVRLTGDCPLVDPKLVDRHLESFLAGPDDQAYVSNAVERTFPDGLDVEVFSRAMLIQAAQQATAPYDREHVTPWIRRHARHVPVKQEPDLSQVRWVLDTADDYHVIRGIFEALHSSRPAFDAADVYRLQVDRPHLIRVAGTLPIEEVIARMQRWMGNEAAS
jgi:spore coat polysaccharide biosynthesis protein SpsF (cytidylyltransferase family)